MRRIQLISLKKSLERAKGFEPSTPTLARSCSTTELHPHPSDWRRYPAGKGRPMPNAALECNSRRMAQISRMTGDRQLCPKIRRKTAPERPPILLYGTFGQETLP